MWKHSDKSKHKRIIAKIVMLGDGAVGKTALVQRFVKQSFGGKYKATMGLDLSLKEITYPEVNVGIQLWDMGGQIAFKPLRSRFYRGAQGAVLVYDITRPQTFHNLESWRKELEENLNSQIPFILLGNKCDLHEMELVSTLEEKSWALKTKAIGNYRSSAKTGENVDEAFHLLASKLLEELMILDKKQEKESEKIDSHFKS
ncbi:MAG: Rab family GTPase [Promethearchaeota archaeon]